MPRLLLCVGLSAVVAALVGARSTGDARAASVGPARSPAAFALSVVRLVVTNNYADVWTMLATIEQASVPRGLYVGCEEQTPIPGKLARARVVRIQRKAIAVPGLSRTHSGYAVTVQTTIAMPRSESVTTQMIIPVIIDTHRLAWILRPERFNAYRHGHCYQQQPPA